MSLADEAFEYVRRTPRRNPPDDVDVSFRVQGFCIDKKMRGDDLGDNSESEWRDALEVLGVEEDALPMYMEDVASWSVDD